MLILSRKLNEMIRLGDEIIVTVVEIRRDKVRIGVTAPDHVAVDRQEIWEKKRAKPPSPPEQSWENEGGAPGGRRP